ncbi:alpha-tocopherol transfer protein-like isoform X3 [Coccinella septempunctata]|uniref:alpha-tocopherol transfer protein-like isoform X3 n=1 Tax=Coccinella septempunctata TaxID=41139 RepID=UPI001D062C8F|nr:alpha-tocopherol transfer protein-like isoform X3 [Coccinella septempunctata]
MFDAKKEYEKNPQLKKEDVESLRSWAEKQPHLPKISELQYILFLQSCYYSNEQAKSAIENFFTVRTLCRDIFANGNPKDPAIQMALDVGLVTILPKVAPSGYKVVFMKLLDTNPDKYILLDELRMFDMVITLLMNLQGTNEGLHIVFDFEGSTFAHLLKYTSLTAKKYLFYVQEALPIRLKDIHIIHAPTWIDRGLAIVKPLIKKELFDMINIHTTMDTFYKKVPQEMLLKDFGGTLEPCKVLGEQMRAMLEKNEQFFKDQEAQITDESKRVEKSTDLNKIFGLEGTFKKLEVD